MSKTEPGKPPIPQAPTSSPSPPADAPPEDEAEWESIQEMMDQLAHQKVQLTTANVPVTAGHMKAAHAEGPMTLPEAHTTERPDHAVVIRDAVMPTRVLRHGFGKLWWTLQVRWRSVAVSIGVGVLGFSAAFIVKWRLEQSSDRIDPGAARAASAEPSSSHTSPAAVPPSSASASPSPEISAGMAPPVASEAAPKPPPNDAPPPSPSALRPDQAPAQGHAPASAPNRRLSPAVPASPPTSSPIPFRDPHATF